MYLPPHMKQNYGVELFLKVNACEGIDDEKLWL